MITSVKYVSIITATDTGIGSKAYKDIGKSISFLISSSATSVEKTKKE